LKQNKNTKFEGTLGELLQIWGTLGELSVFGILTGFKIKIERQIQNCKLKEISESKSKGYFKIKI
jgi:hypothetical protein